MVSNIQNLRFTNSVEIPQNKVQTQLRPKNSETQQDSFEKSGLSKNQKRGLIAAGLATIILIGSVIVNKHNRAKRIKQIPEELRAIFNDLKGEKGENFINKAYDKLKNYMKLDEIVPDKIEHLGADKGCFALQGGYNPTLNTIGYTDGFFTKIDKASQFSLIAHELKHADQTAKIIRAGLLPEYAKAWAEQSIRNVRNNPLEINFNLAYREAVRQGKGKEFLDNTLKNSTETIMTKMKESHKNTLNLPRYKKDSQEYKDAENYIEATRNYVNLNELGLGSKDYYNNPLEKEAYDFGNKMEKYFRDFFG